MVILSEKTQPSPTLPDDVIMDCIVPRVSRCNYPVLSLVSKQLRSLVKSPELCMRRSVLGCTEECVYVLVTNTQFGMSHWYTLNRGINRNRLAPILSLPPMPILANYAVVGSKIFVMGGNYGYGNEASTTLCIDCQTHTARRVADMPFVVRATTSKVEVDKKIYVIGEPVGVRLTERYVVMVFDPQTETWKYEAKAFYEVYHKWRETFSFAEIDNIPKEAILVKDEISEYTLWDNQCVMDEVLYEYDGDIIRTYDSKHKIQGVVKGLGKLPSGVHLLSEYHIVGCNKKLILFLVNDTDPDEKTEIWCVEITVEKTSRRRDLWKG